VVATTLALRRFHGKRGGGKECRPKEGDKAKQPWQHCWYDRVIDQVRSLQRSERDGVGMVMAMMDSGRQ
jgi:hypothetical protein